MASIRKCGNSYLIVVSTGYDYQGNRRKSQQKTVKPPDGLTPKQIEKWLNEQAMIFEKQIKSEPVTLNKNITVAQYIEIFKNEVSPVKHAKSTQNRNKIEYERILPYLGHIKQWHAVFYRRQWSKDISLTTLRGEPTNHKGRKRKRSSLTKKQYKNTLCIGAREHKI